MFVKRVQTAASAAPRRRGWRGLSARVNAVHEERGVGESWDMPGAAIMSVQVGSDGGTAEVLFGDRRQGSFLGAWLLDNCSSRRCKETGQKIMFPSRIPEDLMVESVAASRSTLVVRWGAEGRAELGVPLESHFHATFLAKAAAAVEVVSSTPEAVVMGEGDTTPTVSYEDVMSDANGDEGVWRWTDTLSQAGLCVITNVPRDLGIVAKVASRIGPVTEMLYGSVFDVRREEQPINIAYTNACLEPHMDLAYYESPPGLQFLHCIQFGDQIVGGESTFVDVLAAADKLQRTDPESFDVLTRIPATFQKDHLNRATPAQMVYHRPHINVSPTGYVTAVHWSPPFEGPLLASSTDAAAYYRARAALQAIIDDPARLISLRLRPGDLVSFNQRRMLHGRAEFSIPQSGDGQRHLQGCYVNIDDFLCRLRVLTRVHARSAGENVPGWVSRTPRAGNGDWC